MNKTTTAEPNYNLATIAEGDILTNAKGTRQIKIIRNFIRETKTQAPRVFVFAVLDKNGQIDYNDQKTWTQLTSLFPVKIA